MEVSLEQLRTTYKRLEIHRKELIADREPVQMVCRAMQSDQQFDDLQIALKKQLRMIDEEIYEISQMEMALEKIFAVYEASEEKVLREEETETFGRRKIWQLAI